MPSTYQLIAQLSSPQVGAAGQGLSSLARLYGHTPTVLHAQTQRYLELLQRFEALFPDRSEVAFFSAPGRTEVGGNHTDHNAGRVLAAAVDLDIVAAVAPNEEGIIRVHSEGYPPDVLHVDEVKPVASERYTSAALVRGICARFKELGYTVGGFDAVATSTVPKGSGLSSSAAFEVLIATILNELYNQGHVDPVLLAQIGQFAENNYFGKPCGLMDQTTSVMGGFVTIDFKDFAHPIVRKVEFDFAASGYTLVIVDTWGDHANLTDDYAAVAGEMKAVAAVLGGKVLRDISLEKVLENITLLRTRVSDRAILRAMHFFNDDRRVVEQVAALQAGDFTRFLQLVNESGRSSWMLLQNCYLNRTPEQQGIPVALALSETILGERGAWRVHGGGFAGTIQAFVPNDLLSTYVEKMEAVCGQGACHQVMVRPVGAGLVKM